MTAEVRTGQPEDVSELSDALAPDTSPAHTRQRWHEHTVGHREMLVATLDGRLAGCVGISVERAAATICPERCACWAWTSALVSAAGAWAPRS